jgi:chromosomal replication initiation ATPase DnaA
VSAEEIVAATASHHGVNVSQYAAFRSGAAGRDMAAWLCRRWTGASLGELGALFGLTGTDSVSNLVRRAEKRYKQSSSWRKTATAIEVTLHLNTEHKA